MVLQAKNCVRFVLFPWAWNCNVIAADAALCLLSLGSKLCVCDYCESRLMCTKTVKNL